MTKTAILFSTLLISIISWGQSGQEKFNFGFEKINAKEKLPDNWFQWGTGYKLSIDTVTKRSGHAAVVIEPVGEKQPNTFGCVAYAIPAEYWAEEIELRAYMKLENVTEGPIGLMIRVDGASGPLSFENMQRRNIQGTMDWTLFSVKVPFPQNAKRIFIGAILSGTGKLWVDDFQLLLDGNDINKASVITLKEYKAETDKEFDNGSKISGIELTKSKIENLDVLGKVWGFLKYYHPSVALGDHNWDYELFRILPQVLNSKDQKERNSVLNRWVLSLGDFETVETPGKPDGDIKLTPDLSWINEKVLGPTLTNSLHKVSLAKRSGKHYYVAMHKAGNPNFLNESTYQAMPYPDAGFRLLSLYRYWNIIAYFFPYKNLIEEDWNKVLGEYIPKFINAGDELEYKLTCLSLIARIHDTHANIWGSDKALNDFRGLRYAPVSLTFVENKAVVTGYLHETEGKKSGLKIGDVIEVVEGKTVDNIVKEKLPLTPASNYPTQLRDIARDLLRTNKDLLAITYRSGEQRISTQLRTFNANELNLYGNLKRDTCFKMITPNIAYLYPGSIKNKYLPTIKNEVMKTRGLIIDFRCYPSDFILYSLSEYLLPESTPFTRATGPSIESPGLFILGEVMKAGKSNPDHYKGKVVIIVNETTQSSAEFHSMAFRTAPKAKVIGSTTAGADGNVSSIVLPGGVPTMISGLGIYYPDGTETQRIGIVPDIEVKPTIQGVREGRDEPLDMAIKIVSED